MYIAGTVTPASSHNGDQSQTGKHSGTSTWNRHTGPMSKRFDRNEPTREEQFISKAQAMVRPSLLTVTPTEGSLHLEGSASRGWA
jgi:protein MPE1